ncbi:hypothetical protein ACFFGH_26405 [Lysobacter korlensis]|uniref:DUF7847 domain-containing protein n=1 Tax=Lysobacter korlensis TaxID=553636 RepID=A0ABV6RWL6_9GAMM
MSDDQQWQAPGSPVPPPPGDWSAPGQPAPPSGWGAPGQQPPPPGASHPGAFPPPSPANGAAWAPPPKPGLIPLRPMSLGTILTASFQVLRRNPKPTFGAALLVQGVVTLVTVLVVGLVTVYAVGRAASAATEDQEALFAGAISAVLLASIIPVVFSLIAVALLQGVIVLEVARGTVGEKLRLAGLWRLGRGRIWALVGWVLAVTGIVVVGLAILVGIVVAIVAVGGQAGVVAGVLLGILLFIGVVVVFFWLGTKLSLVPSAIMLERLTIGDAVRRSWSLTRNFFWRVLGITLLVAVILGVAGNVITAPFSVVFAILPGIFAPTGDPTPVLVIGGLSYLLLLMVSALIAAVTSVVQSATAALIYIDLRMRKEGLDLRLQHFVEERAAGNPAAADPYLLPGGAVAPPAGAQGEGAAWA